MAAKIRDQSKGLLRLVKFTKTNGQMANVNGVKVYTMDCSMETLAVQACALTGVSLGNWDGSFGALPAKQNAGMEEFNPFSGAYGGYKKLARGERQVFTTKLTFELTERGWRTEGQLPSDTPFIPDTVLPASPESATAAQSDFIEEFDSNSRGTTVGIRYVATPTGHGAAFGRTEESRIEYSFENGFPAEGTLEWRILVTNGYGYSDGVLSASKPDALVFTTVGPDTWYPGCSWLTVSKDGTVNFGMADSVGGQTPLRSLVAKDTTFRFNEWHTIGISFGSEGRSINVDGHIVAHDALSLALAVGGTPQAQNGAPTIGEMKSRFWPKHQHDSGFEGVVDTFRTSSKQANWKLCRVPGP